MCFKNFVLRLKKYIFFNNSVENFVSFGIIVLSYLIKLSTWQYKL